MHLHLPIGFAWKMSWERRIVEEIILRCVFLQLATAAAAASFSSSTAAQETQQPIIVKKTVKPRKGALKGRQRQKERVDLIQRQNESEAEFTKRKNAFLCTPTVSSSKKNELAEAQAAAPKRQQVNMAQGGEHGRLEWLLSQANQLVQ